MIVGFVRTICPEEGYKEKEIKGAFTIQHFDPEVIENEDDASSRVISCVEASVRTAEYDEEQLKAEYKAWKAAMDALELSQAISAKEKTIDEYDGSPAVNSFILNGYTVAWSSSDPTSPNKSVRMGLRQNIADKIAKGEANITVWLGGMSFTLPCATVEAMMCDLENYAYECFNVTAAHKQAVKALTTIAEVEAYDYKTGYPAILEFTIPTVAE